MFSDDQLLNIAPILYGEGKNKKKTRTEPKGNGLKEGHAERESATRYMSNWLTM